MSFFRNFPTVPYSYFGKGTSSTATNIFRNVDVKDADIDSIVSYQYYRIKDGERPDVISQKIYGTPDYHWTFFVTNDSLKNGLNTWPLSNREVENYIRINYQPYTILVAPGKQVLNSYNEIAENGLTIVKTYAEYENGFSGLDLTPDFLRISVNGNLFEILERDQERAQLWIKDEDQTLINDLRANGVLTFFFTKAEGTDPDEWSKWQTEYLAWVSLNRPGWFKNGDGDSEGFEPFTEAEKIVYELYAQASIITNFLNSGLTTFGGEDILTFIPARTEGKIIGYDAPVAPHHYVTEDGDRVSTYDYYNFRINDLDDFTPTSYVSYVDYILKLNEDRSTIKVVQPNKIRDFATQYRTLLNSD